MVPSSFKKLFCKIYPALASGAVLASATALFGATFDKADNTTNLDQMASWSGGPPSVTDTARWNSIVTGPNTVMLGTNLSWMGILIANPGGPVTINSGNTLTLGASGITMSAATQDLTLNCAVALNVVQPWNIMAGRTLTANGVISGTGGIAVAGAGSLVVSGNNTYTGATTISAGTLLVTNATGSATGTGSVSVAGGAVLGGTGNVAGGVTLVSGAMLSPGVAGPGKLTIHGSLSLPAGSVLAVRINGIGAGQYSQVADTGNVSLGGSSLSLTLGFAPSPGDSFVIIDNDLADAIAGTFTALVEGATVTAVYNSITYAFSASYGGGTGNDLVLTCMENYNTWSNSKAIILNTTSTTGANVINNVFNFPLLVRLTPENFTGFAGILSGGADIRFSKSNGAHLNYEIERWVDGAGNQDTAEIWVNVDTVFGNNATQQIIMHWGKAGAVSRSNGAKVFDTANGFTGVWHLDGNYNDATNNGYNGTSGGTSDTAGVIGRARKFISSNRDSIRIAGLMGSPSTATLSCWVKCDSVDQAGASADMISIGDYAALRVVGGARDSINGTYHYNSAWNATTQSSGGANLILKNGWMHVAYVCNPSGSLQTIYVNGIQVATSAYNSPLYYTGAGSNTFFGKHGNGNANNDFGGLIDEPRIDKTNRSADWIKLCYENQKPNGALIGNHTATWTGAVSGNWSNPSNWSPSGVPGAGDIAMFNATSAACSLTVNVTVGGIVFTNGYSGGFYYSNNTLSVEGDADFRSNGPIYTSVGILEFIGPLNRTFIPKPGAYTANQIKLSGTGVTTVQTNGFQCVNLSVSTGTLNLGSGLVDSVSGTTSLSAGTTLDFGSSTLKYGGPSLSLSTAGAIIAGSGTLEFCGSAGGSQVFMPKPSVMHPAIRHTGTDTLRLSTYPLSAASYDQSAGTIDFNGSGIDSIAGDLTIVTGTKTSLVNIGGTTIRVGGNASLSGQPGNLLGLDPATAWAIRTQGMLSANYAAIRNCAATGGSAGTATNSYDLGNNTNWTSVTGNPRIDPGDSNFTLGRDVVTDKDSTPVMHLRVSTSATEGAFLDTLNLRIKKGPLSAIYRLRLFGDINRNGVFNQGTDPWIHDTTLTIADSSVRFTIGGGHLDSLMTPVDTNEYFIVMDLNNTSISAADTFQFAVNPAAAVFSGRQTGIAVKGGGSWFDGDIIRGDVLPVAANVSSSTTDGTYDVGTTIAVEVAFNKNVFVAGGTPSITLETGTTNRDANYISGSSTSTLTFLYTVQAGDTSADLDYAGSNPINYNGSTIKDAAGRNASLTLPTPGTIGSLGYNKNIVVDGRAPVASAITILDSSGFINLLNVNISLASTGADSMHFRLDSGSWTGWEPSGAAKTGLGIGAGGEGTKTVSVQFKDRSGNLSATLSDITVLDTTKPLVGTVSIQDNNGFTKDIDPPMTFLGITGAGQVRYGVNDSTTFGSWRSFIAPDSVSLGTEGGKRVWVQFRDQAGNLSAKISDTTTYDATAPGVGSMAITDNGGFTNDADPLIAFFTITGADSVRYGVNDSVSLGAWRKYASPDSVTLGAAGGKRIWAQFRDFTGNLSAKISDSTNLDTAKPVLTMSSSSPNPTNVSPIHVTAVWSKPVTDFVSGDLVLTNATAVNFTGSGASYAFDLIPSSQGPAAVEVTAGAARDTAFNLSPAAVPLSRTYDIQGPTVGSMAITDNSGFTNDVDPKITFTGVSGADSVRYGVNDSAVFSPWRSYAAIDSINVGAPPGGKRIWAQFRDLAGNLSAKISDSTFYDVVPPTVGSMVIKDNNGFTKDSDPAILFSGIAGADSVRYGINDSLIMGPWRAYAAVDSIALGPEGGKRVWAQFRDLAGNQSARLSDTTNYDITAPQSPFVNSFAVATNDSTPALGFSAAGADSMRMALAPDTGLAPWRLYLALDSLDIAPGGDGVKMIFAQYKDFAGNLSAWVFDTVTYNAHGPIPVAFSILDKNGYTNVSRPGMAVSAVNADSMAFSLNAGGWQPWEPYASVKTDLDLSTGGNGQKKVQVRFKDMAGNMSGLLADSTVFDTTPPQNATALMAGTLPGNRITLFWNPSVSPDADSCMIRYSTIGYPADTTGGSLWRMVGNGANRDTITAGLSEKTTYYIGMFVRDSARNWSGGSISAQMWVRLPDVTPPANNVTLVATAVDTGHVRLSWNPSAISAADADSVGIWYKTTGYPLSWDEPLAQLAGKFAKKDSSRTIPLPAQSIIFFGLAVRDSSGNWSTMAGNAQDTVQGIKIPGPLYFARTAVVCTVGVPILPDTLYNAGGPFDSVTIIPQLPSGLTIDRNTGVIQGNPAIAQPGITYMVLGISAVGTATCTLSVSVVYPRPKAVFSVTPPAGNTPLLVWFADSSRGFIIRRQWLFGDGTSDSTGSPGGTSHTYVNAGSFPVRLVVTGPGGSDTLTVPGCVSVTDTTIPLQVTGFQLSAVNCSTAVVSWLPSASFDADSVFLAASTTEFPVTPTGGTYRKAFPNVNVTDTLRGLSPGGGNLYAGVFTKDFSANWSTTLKVSVRLPDCIIPHNTLLIAMTNAGDTAIAVKVKTDSSLTDADGFGWLCRQGTPATVADSSSFVRMPYRDSSFVMYPVRTSGLWYLSTAIHDSSGNLSPVRVDTIMIANKPPVIAGQSDVTIREDTLWQTTVAATDWNTDSLVFSLREAPAGVNIDPVTRVVSWTPGDSNVGVNRIIVECGDFHPDGVVRDTIMVTVLNVNEPPKVTISGDTTVLEDNAYRALIQASDPDVGDSAKIVTVEMPSWLTLSHDTISGTPANKNVGVYTLRVIVADRSGLKAEATRALRVVNVNDTPVVQRVVSPAAGYEDSSLTITTFAYDVDAGDSLSFGWVSKPAWLSLGGITVVPERMEWQFALTGTPRAGDVGAADYSFIIKDRAGAPIPVTDRIVIIGRPNTAIGVKQVMYAAARYRLRATNATDTMVTFVTRLTSLADSTVIEKTIGYNAFVEYYPLVDGRYVFTASAVDASGLRETGQLVDTLVIKNATTHTFSGDSTAWQMMSVPLAGIEAGPLRGSGYLVTWDESGPDRDIYGYYTPSKEVRDAVGGRAYWRKSPDTVDISIDKESLVDSTVNIRLSKAKFGWNMIADPYVYPVEWNSPAQAWRWNGSDFELAGSVLEPWAGYWVMAESSTVVTLDPRPAWTDSLRPKLARSAAVYCMSRSDWRMKLSLLGRTTSDRENAIGMNKQASDGFDRTDLYEPPWMQGQGYIFFPHPEWRRAGSEFASDIRRNWEPLNMFEVGIAPWERSDSAVVRIEGYEALAATMSVFVRTGTGITEYNATTGITLPPARETRYITLIVTADRALAQKLPIKFFCGDPYPNPSRSMARVHYTLPYEWSKDGRLAADAFIVKITIYDLAGRAIRNLVNHRKSAGSYEAVWDCKINTGRTVGAGVYMYAVEAGKHRAVKRIMVLR